MQKTISSSMTFFFKYIFSTLWITGFGIGTISVSASKLDQESFTFIFGFIAGVTFLYWACLRLKKISIDEENLYISNYFKEITIQRKNIEKVTQSFFVNPRLIWIHFKQPTEFGKSIIFTPLLSLSINHPIVEELRKSIEKNN
jgi:hypothetical protein